MSQTGQLKDLLREQYRVLDEADMVDIAPAALADFVYGLIDSRSVSPHLVQLAAILELRQLAREVCRERNQEQEDAVGQGRQGSLFDNQLQNRYPTVHIEGSHEYVYRKR